MWGLNVMPVRSLHLCTVSDQALVFRTLIHSKVCEDDEMSENCCGQMFQKWLLPFIKTSIAFLQWHTWESLFVGFWNGQCWWIHGTLWEHFLKLQTVCPHVCHEQALCTYCHYVQFWPLTCFMQCISAGGRIQLVNSFMLFSLFHASKQNVVWQLLCLSVD